MVGVNGRAAGGFYSEEAARLALEAAKRPQQPAAPAAEKDIGPAPAFIPPVLLEEPRRPPLAPEPAINQNGNTLRAEPTLEPRDRAAARLRRPVVSILPEAADERRRPTFARIVAWIILAPWYLAMIAATVAVIGLFVRNLFRI